MDKTLEMVMVIVALVVAAVLVVSTLQGQTSNFGDFADQQTNSSSCGISTSKFAQAVQCEGCSGILCTVDSARANKLYDDNSNCWDGSKSEAKADVCT